MSPVRRLHGYLTPAQRHCPTCGAEVNSAGRNLLVTEQPLPKKRGMARGGGESFAEGGFQATIDAYGKPSPDRIVPTSGTAGSVQGPQTGGHGARTAANASAFTYESRFVQVGSPATWLATQPPGPAKHGKILIEKAAGKQYYQFWVERPNGLPKPGVRSRSFAPNDDAGRRRAMDRLVAVLRDAGWVPASPDGKPRAP